MRISDWSSDVCSSDLTKQGGATISATDGVLGTSLFGNSGAAKKAASAAAGSVTDQINSVMEALGATFSGGGGVTIGQRHGDWRVTTGPSLKIKKGAKEFDDDQEGAIAYAVQLMRSEEKTSELQSLMRISYAVFSLKTKTK